MLAAIDGKKALQIANSENRPDLILLDIIMPGMDGFEVAKQLKSSKHTSDIPIIFITSVDDQEGVIKGFKIGAQDYVRKPFNSLELLARVRTHLSLHEMQLNMKNLVNERTKELLSVQQHLKSSLNEIHQLKNQLQEENVCLQEEIKIEHNFSEIIGHSAALKKILNQVENVASTSSTVLILGETGTGKELIARAIHNLSNRKNRPLVKVNCAALPANLIESELFGHEKGAFTGAIRQKIGRFELADKGTIFLDEIGTLQLELQAKLLRVLQEGELERIGSSQTLKTDVRIIAATNRNLEKSVTDGLFREDLYYRLNVFPLTNPPLRERREDIPLLVNHFVNKYSAKIGRMIKTVPKKIMKILESYHWPGNIRELENIIERAVIISKDEQLSLGDWFTKSYKSVDEKSIQTIFEIEKEHILNVLDITSWRIRGENGAAQILGLKPTTLEARMQKLDIKRK